MRSILNDLIDNISDGLEPEIILAAERAGLLRICRGGEDPLEEDYPHEWAVSEGDRCDVCDTPYSQVPAHPGAPEDQGDRLRAEELLDSKRAELEALELMRVRDNEMLIGHICQLAGVAEKLHNELQATDAAVPQLSEELTAALADVAHLRG